MAGRGPAPKDERYRRATPERGEWQAAPEGGWVGPVPPAPAGLLASSQEAWSVWFGAWWAANWTTDDLPALRLLTRLYDRVSRGDVRRLGELRQLMDSFGITPKGRQDRRWTPPKTGVGRSTTGSRLQFYLDPISADDPYAHLRPPLSAKERFGATDGSESDPRRRLR